MTEIKQYLKLTLKDCGERFSILISEASSKNRAGLLEGCKYLYMEGRCSKEVSDMKVAERVVLLEDGRLRWRRKVTASPRGGPKVALPAELKSWENKIVEIELRSPREVVLRLVEAE